MEEFISNNFISILSGAISLFSLGISTLSLLLNKRTSRLASYSMRGNYSVYFRKEKWWEKFFRIPSFTIKIHNSASSDVIRFEYKLQVMPLVGGIRRMQLFEGIGKGNYIGIDRTGPAILDKINWKRTFPKKYAYDNFYGFNSTPFYPYFSAYYKENNEQQQIVRKINRYHNYLEITDFNGNTEVWYFSFSLYLSNLENDYSSNEGWRKCSDSYYKFYKISEIIVFSPKDLLKNLKASLEFKKDLVEIRGCDQEWKFSERLAKEGFLSFDNDLQLYELREYFQFHEIIKKHI